MKEKFSKTELDKNVEDDNTDLFRKLIDDETTFLVTHYAILNEFIKSDQEYETLCSLSDFCFDEMVKNAETVKKQECPGTGTGTGTGGKKRRNKSRKTGKKRGRKHTKKQRR